MKRAKRKNLTSEEIKQLKEAWSQGLTTKQIYQETMLSKPCVDNYFSAFNKGFDSITAYQNNLALEKGFINHLGKYAISNQQKFKKLVSYLPLPGLVRQQKDYRVVHFYEIDPHELIPKLLNELEKIKTTGKISLIDVIKKHYFQSKSLKAIAKEQGLKSRWTIGLRKKKALEKLREIIQKTEFSQRF